MTMDGSQTRPGLPKRPDETTSYFEDWREWAWKVGQYASAYANGPDGCEQYVRFWVGKMHYTDEQKASLVESYQTAYKRCRKPPDAPERVAECMKWYESRWGIVRTAERLGRSPAYPKLLLFAYCLGRDGKPFTFAKHRIAEASCTNDRTVWTFIQTMMAEGIFILVRDGVSGVEGSPAWYRLQSVKRVHEMLWLHRESPFSSDHGKTFDEYLDENGI